jgi:uncharacterized caspase-like protein
VEALDGSVVEVMGYFKQAAWWRMQGLVICLLLSLFAIEVSGQSAPKPEQSAGLFVGIGKFEFQTGLKQLEYAPDDAVALAYRFVVELKQVAPSQAQVVLAGKPKSSAAQRQLKELERLKVPVLSGTRQGFMKALQKFSEQASSEGLAVMTVSLHGYETQKDVHLMPSDGNWQTVRSTGVSFDNVLGAFRKSRAKSRLLLLDACREVPTGEALDREAAEAALRQRVKEVTGLTLLAACSAGEKSWQAKTLEQGVFTHFVLAGLKEEKLNWAELGDRVVRDSGAWYAKYGETGPKAWFQIAD